MKIKQFLILALLGSSIMTLGPDGMTLGTVNDYGSFMTIGPKGMTLGDVDKQGNLFSISPKGMELGTITPLIPDNTFNLDIMKSPRKSYDFDD